MSPQDRVCPTVQSEKHVSLALVILGGTVATLSISEGI